jgi:hypothetical protein
LLWLWVMSWFAFTGHSFGWEFGSTESLYPQSRVSNVCLMLISTTIVLWVLFFAVDHNARSNARGEKTWKSLVQLSTLAGTILAIYTLLGVVFFVHVAPQLH